MEILKGNEKLFLDSDKLGIAQKIQEEETELSFDEQLYERFRVLRREIALEHEVPAYVIFGDKSLKEFASKLPTTKNEMLDINGVGLVKYEKYGEAFLNLAKEIKSEFSEKLETRAPLKKLTKTYLETFDIVQSEYRERGYATEKRVGSLYCYKSIKTAEGNRKIIEILIKVEK